VIAAILLGAVGGYGRRRRAGRRRGRTGRQHTAADRLHPLPRRGSGPHRTHRPRSVGLRPRRHARFFEKLVPCDGRHPGSGVPAHAPGDDDRIAETRESRVQARPRRSAGERELCADARAPACARRGHAGGRALDFTRLSDGNITDGASRCATAIGGPAARRPRRRRRALMRTLLARRPTLVAYHIGLRRRSSRAASTKEALKTFAHASELFPAQRAAHDAIRAGADRHGEAERRIRCCSTC
jgi:hypothetical protein